MNYLHPSQREATKRWDYTSTNDNITHPIGYCHAFSEWSETSIRNVFGMPNGKEDYEKYILPYREAAYKFHSDGHETEDEACECYKQYRLDFDLNFAEDKEDPDTLHKCENCKTMTSGSARIGQWHHWNLCSNCRNREVVAKLYHIGWSSES